MAPEQAKGDKQLTTAVDIFAMGAVLYELLFGEPPHKGSTPAATIAQIITSDSVKFPKGSHRLDADLETILWKCLQYQPSQRYHSAAAFAEDLERWLEGKPVEARRSQPHEKLIKWAKRKPAIAALSLAMAALVCLTIAGIIREWRMAIAASETAHATATNALAAESNERKLRQESEGLKASLTAERDLLARTRYLAEMQLAGYEWKFGTKSRLKELLDQQVVPNNRKDQRGWEWHFLLHQIRESAFATELALPISCLAWEPNNHRLAAAGYQVDFKKGAIYVVNTLDGSLDNRFSEEFPYGVNSIQWSPDGKWLAVGAAQASEFNSSPPSILSLLDSQSGALSLPLLGTQGDVQAIAWSPDSSKIVAACGNFGPTGQVQVWETESGKPLLALHGLKSQPVAVAWSPNGLRIAGASASGSIFLWNATSGELVREWSGGSMAIRTLLWSPDSELLVTNNPAHDVKVWFQEDGTLLRQLKADGGVGLKWIGNRELELIDNHGKAIAVHVETEKVRERKSKSKLAGYQAASSPDRKRLAFLQENQVLAIEPLQPEPIGQPIDSLDLNLQTVGWSPDGTSLVTGGSHVAIWNAQTRKRTAYFPWPQDWRILATEFSPDGKFLATSSLKKFSGTIHVLDPNNQEVLAEWNGHLGPITAIAWCLDNRRFATLGFDHAIRVWDREQKDKCLQEMSLRQWELQGMARHPTKIFWRLAAATAMSSSGISAKKIQPPR